MMILNQIKESLRFATNSLVANRLRTFLSLLGITIGIFAIISVFSVIDSLEKNIRTSIASLGEDVVYVQKWPWAMGNNYPWWKYLKRPVPQLKELTEIQDRSQKTEAASFTVTASKTVQYKNNSAENTTILGASHDFDVIRSFELKKGRYFSHFESSSGRNLAIIGHDLAEDLFNGQEAVGKGIKVMGHKLRVIGVFAKEGKDLFNNSMDNSLLMPINFTRNIVDIRSGRVNPMIMVKAKEGVATGELIDELKGIMRAIRKLKPRADDDFALNQASLISQGFDSLFKVIDLAGWIIGGFAILVGGFGIANIMFVSVKERTKIIGIQKALGAKRYYILLQFLYESTLLSLTGGILGLLLIYSGTLIAANYIDFEFTLSFSNIVLGLTISGFIGIISGYIPAYKASRLDPVEAINSSF